MAKLWRQGFPGFVEGEMNRWSMKDFENSEKNLYDIVIIDISFTNFEENALNILNLLNPSFHRRVTLHCSAYRKK